MSTHTIQTEVEVELAHDDYAYPVIEITYDYSPPYLPKIPRGEYAPIDPPVGTEVRLRNAKLIMADSNLVLAKGVYLNTEQIERWAEQFLNSDAGRIWACDCAELDLLAMRHAHLEAQRDQ